MRKIGETLLSRLSRVANSTLAFCIAFIIVISVFNLVTAIFGKIFGFDSTVYYYGVRLNQNTTEWYLKNVVIIFSSGTISIFLLGIVFYALFNNLKSKQLVINLIFLWGFVICSSIIAAQGLIMILGDGQYSSPYYSNLAIVAAWLHFPTPIIYLFAILLFLFGVGCAMFYNRPFLQLAYSFSKVNKKHKRLRFLVETAFVPFMLGSGIVFLITFPMNIWLTFIYILYIGISMFITLIFCEFIQVTIDEINRYQNLQTINFFLIIIFVVFVALILLLWKGVYIGR